MKIGIIGNYGATNVGDDAILSSILNLLSGHKVTVFSAQPEVWQATTQTTSVPLFPLGFRSFFRYGFKASKAALKELDLVILGGGGLFQDKQLYACFIWGWQLFWVRWYKKPLFIYATGVGPLETRLGRWLTKNAYRHARFITVRDEDSVNCLKAIGVKNEVQEVADPVFLSQKPEKVESRTKKLFMISLRPWLRKDTKIVGIFTEFLKSLKEEREAELVFVCMQSEKESDLNIIAPLIHQVGGKIFRPKNFSELLELMEKAEFAIGMRYHFMIAAILTHTPLIPISYTNKTSVLFAGSPMEKHLIHLNELSAEGLKNALKELSIGYNNAIVYEHALSKKLFEKAEKGSQILLDYIKTFDQKKPK